MLSALLSRCFAQTLFATVDGSYMGELCYSTHFMDAAQAEELIKSFEKLLRAALQDKAQSLDKLAGDILADAVEIVEHASRELVVAGSFTMDLIEKPLRQTARLLGARVDVELAGFGQVMQSLLNPSSEFYANRTGINILFVRPKDLPDANELNHALHQYDHNPTAAAPLILVICPQLESVGRWALDLATCTKVWPVQAADFCTFDSSDFDERYEKLVSIPYSEGLYSRLAVLALRVASYITRRPFKIVCVDCDNTLWYGVVGEDGPHALRPNLTLQRKLKQCSKRGLVLVTCSKNVLSDVEAAFNAHPEWPLSLSDFVLHKVNWQPKGLNIREAASELGISELQAVAFIDDNPVEIAGVQSMCPEVSTLVVPTDDESGYWEHCWPLDTFRVTAEDAKKGAMMKTELERKAASSSMTFADFIASLSLNVTTSLATDEQVPRVLQMTQKTNQFNFTTERLTSLPDGVKAYVTHVSDKYGDYGLVGVALCRPTPTCFILDNLMMSCRVLGRGVEARMLSQVGVAALEHGLKSVQVSFKPSERNEPAKNFLAKHSLLPDGDLTREYPSDTLAAVTFDPNDMQPAGAPAAEDGTRHAPPQPPPVSTTPSQANICAPGESTSPVTQGAPNAKHETLKAPAITARGADGFHQLSCALSKTSPMPQVSSAPTALDSHVTRPKAKATANANKFGPDALLQIVLEVVGNYLEVVPSPTLPLVDAGVKSLTAVLIARQISERVGLPLPPTLVYSHPTAQDIVTALSEQLAEGERQEMAPTMSSVTSSRPNLYVGGLVGKVPGSVSSGSGLSALVHASADAVQQIPATRWLLEGGTPEMQPLWKMPEIRYQAFIPTESAAAFDAYKFSISRAEAQAMDPQQRLLLELGYAAVHDASRRMNTLARSSTSVAVGMQNIDHEYMAIMGMLPASTYGATGAPRKPFDIHISVPTPRPILTRGHHSCFSVRRV